MDLAELLFSLLSFSLKTLIVVFFVGGIALLPILAVKSAGLKEHKEQNLKVENLKNRYEKHIRQFKQSTMEKKEFKKYLKESNKVKKKKPDLPSLFTLSFKGDTRASQTKNLRDEVSLILKSAKPKDEALLLLESAGGRVASYGLAAMQLRRLRDKDIPLTVCVDKIAASGGYLMACTANQILASPFAIIGSIGVVQGIPNVYQFLKNRDIKYEEFTAGEHKRTVGPFTEVTEEKRQKVKEQIELVHSQFKNFVTKHREGMDLEQTATGDFWLAEEALKRGLVDKLECSDDYIMQKMETHNVYKISLKSRKNLWEKLSGKKSLSAWIERDPESRLWHL